MRPGTLVKLSGRSSCGDACTWCQAYDVNGTAISICYISFIKRLKYAASILVRPRISQVELWLFWTFWYIVWYASGHKTTLDTTFEVPHSFLLHIHMFRTLRIRAWSFGRSTTCQRDRNVLQQEYYPQIRYSDSPRSPPRTQTPAQPAALLQHSYHPQHNWLIMVKQQTSRPVRKQTNFF